MKVSLLQQFSVKTDANKKCYLVEITDEGSVWSVLKRYRQFYELKKHLNNKYDIHLPEFPKRRLYDSYKESTLVHRVSLLQKFLDYLSSNTTIIKEDPLTKRFIRSDIYLESYEELKLADNLRNSFSASTELEGKISLLLEEGEFLKQELDSLVEKHQILTKNIIEMKERNSAQIDSLKGSIDTKKKCQQARVECTQNIQQLNQLFQSLRQKTCLVKVVHSQSKDKLQEYKTQSVELRRQLDSVDTQLSKINCYFLDKNWNLSDYHRILDMFQTKINPQINNLLTWE